MYLIFPCGFLLGSREASQKTQLLHPQSQHKNRLGNSNTIKMTDMLNRLTFWEETQHNQLIEKEKLLVFWGD